MNALWREHYPGWPWWARWFTWHWWKAKIWEANHAGHPGCISEEEWTRASYTGPLKAGSGYVPFTDCTPTVQALDRLMMDHMRHKKLCHTLRKNDETS